MRPGDDRIIDQYGIMSGDVKAFLDAVAGAGSAVTANDEVETGLALQRLQFGYATAMDGLDREALRGVFATDAVFGVYEPGSAEPYFEIRGIAQIEQMVDVMGARFARTMHVMSNCTAEISGDRATGGVYCLAHHLITDDGPPRKFVAYIRYEDDFRIEEGAWRIAHRRLRFQWTQEAAVLSWDEGKVRGRLA